MSLLQEIKAKKVDDGKVEISFGEKSFKVGLHELKTTSIYIRKKLESFGFKTKNMSNRVASTSIVGRVLEQLTEEKEEIKENVKPKNSKTNGKKQKNKTTKDN